MMLARLSKSTGLSRNHRNRSSEELFTAEEFSALHKKEDKAVALRLAHLWACAVELATVNPGASRTLGSQLLDLSITSGVALPRSRAAAICRRCGALLLPGVACTTRAVRRSSRSPAVASAVAKKRADQARKRKVEELASSSVGSLAAAALNGWADTAASPTRKSQSAAAASPMSSAPATELVVRCLSCGALSSSDPLEPVAVVGTRGEREDARERRREREGKRRRKGEGKGERLPWKSCDNNSRQEEEDNGEVAVSMKERKKKRRARGKHSNLSDLVLKRERGGPNSKASKKGKPSLSYLPLLPTSSPGAPRREDVESLSSSPPPPQQPLLLALEAQRKKKKKKKKMELEKSKKTKKKESGGREEEAQRPLWAL